MPDSILEFVFLFSPSVASEQNSALHTSAYRWKITPNLHWVSLFTLPYQLPGNETTMIGLTLVASPLPPLPSLPANQLWLVCVTGSDGSWGQTELGLRHWSLSILFFCCSCCPVYHSGEDGTSWKIRRKLLYYYAQMNSIWKHMTSWLCIIIRMILLLMYDEHNTCSMSPTSMERAFSHSTPGSTTCID